MSFFTLLKFLSLRINDRIPFNFRVPSLNYVSVFLFHLMDRTGGHIHLILSKGENRVTKTFKNRTHYESTFVHIVLGQLTVIRLVREDLNFYKGQITVRL